MEPFGRLLDNGGSPRAVPLTQDDGNTHTSRFIKERLVNKAPILLSRAAHRIGGQRGPAAVGHDRGSERDDRIWDARAALEIVQISVALLIDVSWKNDARGSIKLIFNGRTWPGASESRAMHARWVSIRNFCWLNIRFIDSYTKMTK